LLNIFASERHPLYGRRYPFISQSFPPQGEGHVLVKYRQQLTLRIPTWATNLAPMRPTPQTKLTLSAVAEFIELAAEHEVLCPTIPQKSGTPYPGKSKSKSSTKSRRS
jgi:hypothetical protein